MNVSRTGKISVVIITFNEERNIGDCLKSVPDADEIVVVDAGSSDRTVEIAHGFSVRVVSHPWEGYGRAKNLAIQNASGHWVFSMDADERMTPELWDEIRAAAANDDAQPAVYEVARRAYFLGGWIRHCGWYPGYVPRFFRKDEAHFDESLVHEKLISSGERRRLRHDLIHYTDDILFHYLHKFNIYTSLAARDVDGRGRAFFLRDVILRPPYQFFKMYIVRRGFLDGVRGLMLCLFSASYVFVKYAKLWELRREKTALN